MKITVNHLATSYNNTPILKDVSFEAAHGRFLGIIGPNGSGKSTLLKCIYRLQGIDEGEILLDDVPLSEIPLKESAKKMAVVSQINDLNFDFTAMELVLLGRSPYKSFFESDTKEDYAMAREALAEVGLLHKENHLLSQMSGGEKQRLILARALVQNTKTYLLDEPTNHLDIRHQLDLLALMKKREVTVLAALHDLNLASLYCDDLLALKDGRVVACGDTREVLTKELIRELYGVEAEIEDHVEGRQIRFLPR